MNGIADGLIGATQVVRNRGGRLDLGTGEEDLTAADRKGGRGPEPGLQCGPLVRRERAYKYRCLHVQEYTTCPKVSFGTALGRKNYPYSELTPAGGCADRPHTGGLQRRR